MARNLFVLTALSALFVGCAGPDRAPTPVLDDPAAPAEAALVPVENPPVPAPGPAAPAPESVRKPLPIRRAGNK